LANVAFALIDFRSAAFVAMAAVRIGNMGIKIIKEEKARDYTFIEDNQNLKSTENKESGAKKDRTEPDFRLKKDPKVNKLKKSKFTGGHSMQGHSPVYE